MQIMNFIVREGLLPRSQKKILKLKSPGQTNGWASSERQVVKIRYSIRISQLC